MRKYFFVILLSVFTMSLAVEVSASTQTGGGNTAEAVLKYIHTYQDLEWSASVSESGVDIIVEPGEKQWGLVCTITNIPY